MQKDSLRKIRLFLAIPILCFGIFNITLLEGQFTWSVLIAILFLLPFLCQFHKNSILNVAALWFGFFLILQTLLSPISSKSEYYTLKPSLHYQLDIQGDGLYGMNGMQNISTDERGFRVIPKVDYDNKKGKRIFAIGASTTEEILLDDSITWSHQLQEKLSTFSGNIELINTGLSGLRLKHHIATFDAIQNLDADIALFLIGVNDWNMHIIDERGGTSRNIDQRRDGFLKFFSFRDSLLALFLDRLKFRLAGRMRDEVLNKDVEYIVENGAYYTKQNNSLMRSVKKEFSPDTVSPEYEEQLNVLHQKCEQSNTECIFITQPNGYQAGASDDYKKTFWMTPPNQNYTLTLESLQHISNLYNKRLITFAKSHEYIYCDLASSIPASQEYFYDEVHFNIRGSQAVAEFLFTCLKDRL